MVRPSFFIQILVSRARFPHFHPLGFPHSVLAIHLMMMGPSSMAETRNTCATYIQARHRVRMLGREIHEEEVIHTCILGCSVSSPGGKSPHALVLSEMRKEFVEDLAYYTSNTHSHTMRLHVAMVAPLLPPPPCHRLVRLYVRKRRKSSIY